MDEAAGRPMNDPSAAGTDERLARAIAAFVRAEFKAPVDVVSSFIDLLAEDAAREPMAAFRDDLGVMKAASGRLGATIERLLDASSAQQSLSPRQRDAFTASLRHELRTPITAIMGYADLLIEEARETDENGIVETLESLLAAARRLLGGIDTMVEFIQSGSRLDGETEAGPSSDGAVLIEQAVAALRSVLSTDESREVRATGFILVVDDNPSALDLLTRRLERDGHAVCACGAGDAALRAAASNDFDLAVLDLMMPGMNGVDVLKQLRDEARTAALPVVLMSGADEVESAVRCIEAGADDILQKPIDPVLLRARVSALLERKFLRDRENAALEKLRQERERSEKLLRSMLPKPVVERLRLGEIVIADQFDSATILFCDLVGFTAFSSNMSPSQTIALLNTVFSAIDQLTADSALEKIKTIGDAYLLAGGLPRLRPDHVEAVCAMAVQIPAAVAAAGETFGIPLEIRVGIHTGPVAAGIIGTDKLVYDVWGDTVNVASRMERTGVPGRIHISGAVRTILGDTYCYEAVPGMEIKGKGRMDTFLIK